ncbi:MAG: LCP family protein [Firmicutes bacterium]|nr:LCP family protein [Bacillota bacterium]
MDDLEKIILKRTEKKKSFYTKKALALAIFEAISVCVFLFQLVRLFVLPAKYLAFLFVGLLFFMVFSEYLLLRYTHRHTRKKSRKILAYVLSIFLCVTSCIGTYFLHITYDTLYDITKQEDESTRHVKLYRLNDYSNKTLEDVQGKTVGILKNFSRDHVDACIKELNEQEIKFQIREYDSSIELMNNLKGKALDYIILDESYLTTIEDYEGYEDIVDYLLEMYSYSYKVKKVDISKDVDVTTTPFTVLISGSDSRVGIDEISRSDVNMVIQVNPITHVVLMISIPRDYYVETACDAKFGCAVGKMDKLTHTGLHGVETTQATIEKLLDIEINYNAVVTFDTVTQLVDSLDGIIINNGQEVELDGFVYEVGNIKVNGKQALRYARERHRYASGDRQRGKNQMNVVRGIINKMMSTKLLTNFSKIMDSIKGTFKTNMSLKDMTKLVNKQLDENIQWAVFQYSLDGTGGTDFAYELGDNAYVMYPDEKTVQRAKTDLQAVKNGEAPIYKNN